jgi:Co/Zn/Cd efflux system component
MFLLTITTATIEIVYGLRSHSNSLIADGLYSFAEGLCLIGVMLVLYSYNVGNRQKNNTFGHERLELLFGLIQEVFLLSISLGIIVDAINHLINPMHVHDPQLLIMLGIIGIFVGILGMGMFWGYHHDHDIEEEINEKKKKDFLVWTKKHTKSKHKSTTVVETPLMVKQGQNKTSDQTDKNIDNEINTSDVQQPTSTLDAFTYENVELGESRIYATLHALCLHSFVRFFR